MSGVRTAIDGKFFKTLMSFGAENLKNNAGEVNELNVFPIPDGDTGENMLMTFKGGLEKLSASETDSVGEAAAAFSDGMLLNARGNSGVILSQLFYGLSEGLKGIESASVKDFSHAMEKGVARAYGAVAKPVEGTILTVARESLESVRSKADVETDVETFFNDVLKEMKKSLEHTPELLQTLKEAGVIDSGGAGLVYIMEGFLNAFGNRALEEIAFTADTAAKSVDFSAFNENSVLEFGYCTEFLLQLQNSKTDADAFDVKELIEFLNTVGNSIVAFKTGTVVKVHVHTFEPWRVLRYAQSFGEFLTVKIENMTLQHNETVKPTEKLKTHVKRARRKFGTVTVASGTGLINVFKELGADAVISGGQTDNPSAEEFIDAFDEVNADYIFVLPNNGNVILAAKQAAQMYKNSDVRVIESKSIGEGYSALSMIDYGPDDPDVIEKNLIADMNGTVTGMLTHAVRDTSLNGVNVNKNDYIGFTRENMIVSEKDKKCAIKKLADNLLSDGKQFMIAVYGEDATEEEKTTFGAFIANNYPKVEFYEIDGGQSVYDFILIAE